MAASGVWCAQARARSERTLASEFLDAPCRIAVPGLAPRALPKMAIGLEAAGGTPIPRERLDRLVQGALYQGMELLVFEFFAGHPFSGNDQRRFALEVGHIALARRVGLRIEHHQGIEHIQRRARLLTL